MLYSLNYASNPGGEYGSLEHERGEMGTRFFLRWIELRMCPPKSAFRFFISLLDFSLDDFEVWKSDKNFTEEILHKSKTDTRSFIKDFLSKFFIGFLNFKVV